MTNKLKIPQKCRQNPNSLKKLVKKLKIEKKKIVKKLIFVKKLNLFTYYLLVVLFPVLEPQKD